MPIKTFKLQLAWAKMIAPQVRHLALRMSDDNALDFIPGQFITFHFAMDGKTLRRSYSIATLPGHTKPKEIEIAVGYVENGLATKLLFELQPGDELTTAGPFGRLVLREEPVQRYILVATSTGVTPYRAMLPELAKRLTDSDLQVVLLLGVQTKKDLLYADDFLTFAEAHPNFEFRAHYSREELVTPQPYEYSGYVQCSFAELKPNPETDIVYLCGNPSMIDDAYGQLQALNFTANHVRREKYISS